MCGIIGAFSFTSQLNESLLQHALKTLIHRGPDASQSWLSANKNVALGHTRLSIIDLYTGTQPLSNETNSLHLIVNGEFYGYENQRQILEKKGHHFKTKTDSEIALHLYEDMGADCLAELRGEFALILWDENNELCFAARDRFGIKPLFYAVHNNTLLIASEIKALLALGVPSQWDDEAMMMFTKSTVNLGNQTQFKGIFQIPPGHYLIATKSGVQIFKYWDMNYVTDNEYPSLSRNEYIIGLREQLEEAVRIRLRADVPVACYLSGGLDSSTIIGMASAFSKEPISAFTLAFDKKEYDEEIIAKEMADKVGAIFRPIPIKQSDLADNFEEAIWHGETFFWNGHGIAKFILSRAVRDAGFKVVLTGEGADELFGGYPHFRIDQLLSGHKHLSPLKREELLNYLKSTNQVSIGMLFPTNFSDILPSVQKMLGFTPTWFLISMQGAQKFNELLSEDFKQQIIKRDAFKILLNTFDIENQLKNRDPVNQSLYLWSKLRLPQYLLTILGDRMEMAHSIEGRLPFLDHHVAEYMRSVPVNLKIHELNEKYILREAAKPVITETIYKRQKHPFLAPPATGDAEQPFNDLLQSTLRGSTLANIPFFNQKKIVALLDSLPKMTKEQHVACDPILMTLMSICVMHKRFKMSS